MVTYHVSSSIKCFHVWSLKLKAVQTVTASLSVPTYTTKHKHKILERQHSLPIGSLQLHFLRHLSQVPEDMTGTSNTSDSTGNVGVTLFFQRSFIDLFGERLYPGHIWEKEFLYFVVSWWLSKGCFVFFNSGFFLFAALFCKVAHP